MKHHERKIDTMKKKYMFFDIDGTLTCGVIGMKPLISDLTKDTLKALKNAGHFIAIATGRPYFMCSDIAKEVEITNIVCNGGNDVYIDGVCKQEAPLNYKVAISLIHQCMEKDIAFAVSISNDLIRYTHNDAFSKLLNHSHFLGELRIEPNFCYENKAYKRLFIDKSRAAELDFHGLLVGSSYKEAYVIVEPDDKYHGIEVMMKHLQAPLEDVVVFGDGNNDIRMFEQAAISVAMGNAVPKLKEIATFITHDSDKDGIAYACEHFGWL